MYTHGLSARSTRSIVVLLGPLQSPLGCCDHPAACASFCVILRGVTDGAVGAGAGGVFVPGRTGWGRVGAAPVGVGGVGAAGGVTVGEVPVAGVTGGFPFLLVGGLPVDGEGVTGAAPTPPVGGVGGAGGGVGPVGGDGGGVFGAGPLCRPSPRVIVCRRGPRSTASISSRYASGAITSRLRTKAQFRQACGGIVVSEMDG